MNLQVVYYQIVDGEMVYIRRLRQKNVCRLKVVVKL